ncbi:MAG: DUF4834 family protein [Bacteroidales bacterium]|jgi:hypothetical protein|nr:DUF4834 family protein [Bacteroidales bacterium]
MGIFKALLMILAIYLIYKVSKIIIPIRRYVKEVNKRMQQEENLKRRTKEREGEVKVNYAPRQPKNISSDEGDYVDFEEVK